MKKRVIENDQLQAIVSNCGYRCILMKDYLAVPFLHTDHTGRSPAIGLRLRDQSICSAFICPGHIAITTPAMATELVQALNRSMPVGKWSFAESNAQLRYSCRLPMPKDAIKRDRFIGSFVRKQIELMNLCCHAIRMVSVNGLKAKDAVGLEMRRLQPLVESLPKDQQVTPSQWARAMKTMDLETEIRHPSCQIP
jgi:hypothetical protein